MLRYNLRGKSLKLRNKINKSKHVYNIFNPHPKDNNKSMYMIKGVFSNELSKHALKFKIEIVNVKLWNGFFFLLKGFE